MTRPLRLISFDLCPYVQRAAIVLREKDVPFERVDIDLADKPGWFLEISPTGKVPVLQVGDDALFESAPIVEYLEETHAPALHPSDPVEKARHRAWMEFGSAILGHIWILETTGDRSAFDNARKALREKFEKLEAVLSAGPFFAGKGFSIVDAVFAPAFRYFDTFDRITDLGVFDGLPKVEAWRKALAGRESVKGAVRADYDKLLHAFLVRQGGVLANMIETGRSAAA